MATSAPSVPLTTGTAGAGGGKASPTRREDVDPMTYTMPKGISAAEYAAEVQAVADGVFRGTPVHVAPIVNDSEVPDFIRARLGAKTLGIAAKYRSKILGVDFSAVVSGLLVALAAARKSGSYESLFRDLNLGVATAYTISRDTAEDYKDLEDSSVYKQFEVRGRKAATDPTLASKNAWVVGSNMNASAVRLAGYLVVESAPPGGFLAEVKKLKGTPFSPVQGGKELEKLIRELGTQLTENEKSALKDFSEEFKKVIQVLDSVWGKAGASTEAAKKAAALVKGALL